MDKLLFNVLEMIAEFESGLISMRSRKGMEIVQAKGRLRGKQHKPTAKQEVHLIDLHTTGDMT
ncbi:hypothetical protein GCM10025778_27430 [Paeniglutamicibacter antarcticus]|uniref:Resolvase/invertase-type recombinase catalytic domain-containing protein n=2 Tax=Paeniglutamicibacter antarcticus TaxID=494023 RepID=A0ABP9TPV0_9MICC